MPGKFRFLFRRQRTSHDVITVVERHLTCRDATDLRSHSVVDLVTNRQESEEAILSRRSEIDGLSADFIKMLRGIPPVARGGLTGRTIERSLRHIRYQRIP